jgi:DNA-binding NarL/FixJ family response regulator
MNIRVAIVEDSAAVRDGLGAFIKMSPGFHLVANCRNGAVAVKELPASRPDVTLMDINMPEMNGIECVRKLRPLMPDSQFLMLTIEENSQRVFAALEAGAHGYLVKNLPPDRILEAIKEVHEGGSPISPQIARMLVQSFQRPGTAKSPAAAEPDHNLTERELQILQLFAQGNRAKDVADQLNISVYTVQTHVRNIYEKLHVRSLPEAVVKARIVS